MANKTQNKDTGSLKIGAVPAALGDLIQVNGEKSPRKITYLMGSGDRTHAVCKGTGPMPTGEVEFEIVQEKAAKAA